LVDTVVEVAVVAVAAVVVSLLLLLEAAHLDRLHDEQATCS